MEVKIREKNLVLQSEQINGFPLEFIFSILYLFGLSNSDIELYLCIIIVELNKIYEISHMNKENFRNFNNIVLFIFGTFITSYLCRKSEHKTW